MIHQLIHGVLAASLSSAIFTTIFILARKYILNYIGPTWHYYAWISIFIPWIVIWLPWNVWTMGIVFYIYHLIKPFLLPGLARISFLTPLFHLFINGSAYSSILTTIFFIFWITGFFFSLIYILSRHIQFVSLLKEQSRPITAAEENNIKTALACEYLPISTIYLSSAITSPMLCHLIYPTIYLPINFFLCYSLSEQNYVLKHELYHFKRRDLLANAAMLLLCAINWFNPFIFLANRYFRHAQELSCDANVSKWFSSSEKKAYGYALLKTVMNYSQTSTMHCWWNTGIELKERCQLLKLNHSHPFKMLIGFLIFMLTICTAITAVSLENRNTLFAYSIASAKKSDFVIKLFNNTLTQPLHYSIKSEGLDLARGELLKGDNHGEFITINGILHDKKSAEILIDNGNHIIWKAVVTFYDKSSYFHIQTLQLDSHYHLGSNIFRGIPLVVFDVIEKIHA